MTFKPGQSGNPTGSPKGSVNKQLAMLREAVEKVLPLVVERALAGDADAQKLILERGLPKFKAVEAPVEFSFMDEDAENSPKEILRQASEGQIPLSTARELMFELLPAIMKQPRKQEKSCPEAECFNSYLRDLLAR